MTTSTISEGNKVTKFKKKVAREYVRGGKFSSFIGKDENKVIQVVPELKKCSMALIGKLSGAGVRGSAQLSGGEESLSNHDYGLEPTYLRNGVLIDNEENEKSEFDLFKEARPALTNWMSETKRDQIIQAMCAIEAGGTYYNYGGVAASGATNSSAASAANMDTWLTNNEDRILYGAAKGNLTAGNHTTSLGTIDTTNDKLTPTMISLMKRMAGTCAPLIRPIMLKGDDPWYVLFVGSYSFRDLKEHPVMQAAMKDALPRTKDNPLFAGGDLVYDGVIIKEIPDIDKFIDSAGGGLWDGVWGANATGDNLATAGNTATRVGVGFFCGAQAIGFGLGRPAFFKGRKEDDYGHLNGVAIAAKQDFRKTFANNKQHGMLTSFHSSPAD